MNLKDLKRDTERGTLGGVCAGLAPLVDAPVWVIRALFLGSALFVGGGFWLYLILWVLVPTQASAASRADQG